MFDVLSQLEAIANGGGYVNRDASGRRKKQHHTFKKNSKTRDLYDMIRTYHQAKDVLWTSLKVQELWGWERVAAKHALHHLFRNGYLADGGKVGAFVAYRFEGEKP